ncbi:UNVERIFIED_CONTAM: hypothetical protein NCL1_42581 [Trichonephila clavipes]
MLITLTIDDLGPTTTQIFNINCHHIHVVFIHNEEFPMLISGNYNVLLININSDKPHSLVTHLWLITLFLRARKTLLAVNKFLIRDNTPLLRPLAPYIDNYKCLDTSHYS